MFQLGRKRYTATRGGHRMRLSTVAIAVGAVLFVLPIPGTFVLGGALIAVGVLARLLGGS